uniref:WAP domain-containing protein n=1 Tax=Strigamia maritima TaxID=126957 RepID=T1JKG1_STRMM
MVNSCLRFIILCFLTISSAKQESHAKTFQLTQRRETYISLVDFCPPVTYNFTNEECNKPSCTSVCSGTNEYCCFNGCVYTCTPIETSHSAIDWTDDLRKIPVSFESDDEPEIECSTSAKNAQHLCPSGHICQMLDKGDPLRRIPNKGVCIDLKNMEKDSFFPVLEDSQTGVKLSADKKEIVYLPGGCFLTSDQYGDIEEFLKGMHFTSCVCSAGSVVCSVPQVTG